MRISAMAGGVRIGMALALAFTAGMTAAGGEAAQGLDIRLTAEEYAGVAGIRHITCGVPLAAGQARETKDLRLAAVAEDGRRTPVPAQFRELARWWRADNSLRWVLVDFAAEVGGKQKLAYSLTAGGSEAPAPDPALSVKQDEASITVDTGVARFTVNRAKFTGIGSAIVDVNGDGKLEPDEDLLAASPDSGLVMEDTYGEKYFGADGTESVEVVESGPVRVCVRARGRNLARGGKGYPAGMYGYDVFLNFYAGSAEVFADVIVTNNAPASIGTPTFEDASLTLRLAGGAREYKLIGEKPIEGQLAAGESVCLYQDSNGADSWEKCPGFGSMDSPGWSPLKTEIVSFRGFKVTKRAGEGQEEEIGSGDHARGLLLAAGERGGVIVHTLNFWQQFPKAAELSADGAVRIGLFPRECRVPHFLEDTSAKGHEIVLSFFGGKAGGAAARPAPEAVADSWDSRVYLRPTLEHMAAVGALADVGSYTPPTQGLDKKPDTRQVANGPRMLTTDQLYGNAYGWHIFGDRWRSNGGHGKHGARQPIEEDNYLMLWYVTGLPEWLAAGDARSRHFRDVRRYRVDGQDPFGFKNWGDFKKANNMEDGWCRRPQPEGADYERHTQGIWKRSEWPYPNPEHTTLDLLYDRYLLFGDIRCFENMRIAAAAGGYFAGRGGAVLKTGGADLGTAWKWRAHGWGWRALERYWDLTGDKAAGECLQDVIRTNTTDLPADSPLLGINPNGKKNWWMTNIYSRAVSMTLLHTGDERLLDRAKKLAEGDEKRQNADRLRTLFATLYHLTGNDEQYRQPVVGEGLERLQAVGGYYTACDHWLLTQPPAVKE